MNDFIERKNFVRTIDAMFAELITAMIEDLKTGLGAPADEAAAERFRAQYPRMCRAVAALARGINVEADKLGV